MRVRRLIAGSIEGAAAGRRLGIGGCAVGRCARGRGGIAPAGSRWRGPVSGRRAMGSAGTAAGDRPVCGWNGELRALVEVVLDALHEDRLGRTDAPPSAHPRIRDRVRGHVVEPAAEPFLDEHHRTVRSALELDQVDRAKSEIGRNRPLLSVFADPPHVPEHRTVVDWRPPALVARVRYRLRLAHPSGQGHERDPALDVARLGKAHLDRGLGTAAARRDHHRESREVPPRGSIRSAAPRVVVELA